MLLCLSLVHNEEDSDDNPNEEHELHDLGIEEQDMPQSEEEMDIEEAPELEGIHDAYNEMVG